MITIQFGEYARWYKGLRCLLHESKGEAKGGGGEWSPYNYWRICTLVQQTPANKKLWIKNVLAHIWQFNIQKYKNLFSQVKSSRFLYVVYIIKLW